MIIDDAVKTVVSVADKVGSRTNMILLSVLAPGFLIVCEISACFYLIKFGTSSVQIIGAADIITHNFLFATLLIFFLLSLSFAAGFLSRELAFFISDHFLKRQRPGRTIDAIRFKYGGDNGDLVDEILSIYPVFKLCSKEEQLKDYSKRRSDFYMRNYCKLWLRVKVATLSIEGMEMEINIFLSLVLPTAGIALPYIGFHWMDWAGGDVWIPLASVVVAFLMMWKINDARRYETEQALVHFLFAHWEKLVTIDKPIREGGAQLQVLPYSRRRSIGSIIFRNLFKQEG